MQCLVTQRNLQPPAALAAKIYLRHPDIPATLSTTWTSFARHPKPDEPVHMARSSSAQLGHSWVVSNGQDSGSEWNGEGDLSLSESEPDVSRMSSPRTQAPRRSDRTPAREPEFIMPSMEGMHSSSRRATPSSSPRNTQPRRRFAPPSPAIDTRSIPRSRPQQPPKSEVDTGSAADKAFDFFFQALGFFVDILFQALGLIKKPLALLLALYLTAGLLTLFSNLLTNSVYTALTPLCRIPGVSLLGLPICSYSSPHGSPGGTPTTIDASSGLSPDPEFESLMSAQNHLSEILDDTTASLSLPLSMKRSETGIRDLRQIVRFSSLSSRSELVFEFDGFIETARTASYDLQKFNSHVGRAVDVTLSTARWTERILDDMSHQSDTSISLLPPFMSSLLYPFTPVPFTSARLLDQYLVHTNLISAEIASLIDEAQALLLLLQNLEDRLEVIHSISFQSQQHATASKDEILSHLWTLLGGNRAQLSKYNGHLRLLRQVGEYRSQAFAHVSGTILKLQAMGAELEELRTRVDAAGLEASVKGSGAKDVVPLEVHIESIRLGVERLEEGRQRAREVERGYVRRVLDVSESGNLGAEQEGRLGLER